MTSRPKARGRHSNLSEVMVALVAAVVVGFPAAWLVDSISHPDRFPALNRQVDCSLAGGSSLGAHGAVVRDGMGITDGVFRCATPDERRSFFLPMLFV